MQRLIGKKDTFSEGIRVLIELRDSLFLQISHIAQGTTTEAFSQMPFKGVEGYHSKTLAYSIWHIFRIEDIVVHSLIAGDEQVLFAGGWQQRIGSPIITTGNELEGDDIAEFSGQLNIQELYAYALAVKETTDQWLKTLDYSDMKKSFGESDKEKLLEGGCVSHDESAVWLIDYWCGKNVAGLIRMPMSRHWIMHIEAMMRIMTRLERK